MATPGFESDRAWSDGTVYTSEYSGGAALPTSSNFGQPEDTLLGRSGEDENDLFQADSAFAPHSMNSMGGNAATGTAAAAATTTTSQPPDLLQSSSDLSDPYNFHQHQAPTEPTSPAPVHIVINNGSGDPDDEDGSHPVSSVSGYGHGSGSDFDESDEDEDEMDSDSDTDNGGPGGNNLGGTQPMRQSTGTNYYRRAPRTSTRMSQSKPGWIGDYKEPNSIHRTPTTDGLSRFYSDSPSGRESTGVGSSGQEMPLDLIGRLSLTAPSSATGRKKNPASEIPSFISSDPEKDLGVPPPASLAPPPPPAYREPAIHSAEFPDAEEDGTHVHYYHKGRDDFHRPYGEGKGDTNRCPIFCIITCLCCALIAMAVAGGGLWGAGVLSNDEDDPSPVGPPPQTAAPTGNGTGPPTKGPTPIPQPATDISAVTPTLSPTVVATSSSTTSLPTTTVPTSSSAPSSLSTTDNSSLAPSASSVPTTLAPTTFSTQTSVPSAAQSSGPTHFSSTTSAPTVVQSNSGTQGQSGGNWTATNAPTECVPVFGRTCDDSNQNPTVSPTTSGTSIYETRLFELIADASFDQGAAIQESGTAQNEAFDWLINEDTNLTLSNERKIQRYALATFFFGTGGDGWLDGSGWLDPMTSECEWAPAFNLCGGTGEQVKTLEFLRQGVGGQLPPEVGLLTALTHFEIDNVEFGVGLTGGVPSELGLLTAMETFSLRGNAFTQALPEELFANWLSATEIVVESSGLPGEIPSSIGNLASATYLSLAQNALTGTIPESIGDLESISHLDFSENDLEGPLPSALGTMATLRGLFLNDNELTGGIPELGALDELQHFHVENNKLDGAVPDLTGLENLVEFFINDNDLTGALTCEVIEQNSAEAVVDCEKVECLCCEC